MLIAEVNTIKDLILQNNPYLHNGYTNVYQNTDYGIILEDGSQAVFPASELGNYFYLRLPNNVNFRNGGEFTISDSIKGLGLIANIVLVACVSNADPDKLLENLLNTLMHSCEMNIDFTSAIIHKNDVISQELAFMSEVQRSKAKANVPDRYTIVSLSFTLAHSFKFNKCIVNPCNC